MCQPLATFAIHMGMDQNMMTPTVPQNRIWGSLGFGVLMELDPYPVSLKKAESRPCSMSESVRAGTTLPRPLDCCHQRQLQLLQPGALAAIQAQTKSLSPPKSLSPRLQNSSSSRISNHVPQPSHCLNHRQSRLIYFIHFMSFRFISFPSIPFRFISFPSIPFRFISFPSIPFRFIPFHGISSVSFRFISFDSIWFYFIPLHSSQVISFHVVWFHSFIDRSIHSFIQPLSIHSIYYMYLFIHACMNTSSYLRIRSDTSHPTQLPTPKQHLQDSIVEIPVMIQFQLDQWPSETLKRKNIHHIHKSYTNTHCLSLHDIILYYTHTHIYIYTYYRLHILDIFYTYMIVYDRMWNVYCGGKFQLVSALVTSIEHH